MVYVKHFDILGIDTAQIPCIELQGPPTTATEGAVGLLGMDVLSGGDEIYVCTAKNGAIYTWKPLKDGKDGVCVRKAEINSEDQLIITLSDGTTLNAGVVKGEKGDKGEPGKDGINGKDGVGIEDVLLNSTGELVVLLTNGVGKNFGKVTGEDGVSIVKVEKNAKYELLITLSNDTIINVGSIKSDSAYMSDFSESSMGFDFFGVKNSIHIKNIYPEIRQINIGETSSSDSDVTPHIEKYKFCKGTDGARVGGASALNNDEFPTLGQLKDGSTSVKFEDVKVVGKILPIKKNLLSSAIYISSDNTSVSLSGAIKAGDSLEVVITDPSTNPITYHRFLGYFTGMGFAWYGGYEDEVRYHIPVQYNPNDLTKMIFNTTGAVGFTSYSIQAIYKIQE